MDMGEAFSEHLRVSSTGQARLHAGQHVVVIWQRFLSYHVARLRHLQRRLQREGIRLSAVEVASTCASYDGFPIESDYGEDLEHICCFPGMSYHDFSAEIVRDKVLEVLNDLMPDVVFAPATPVPEGMAAVAYRLSSGKRIVMMDDAWQHTDRRSFFVSSVKRIIHRNIDAAFVPAPSHRPYYERMGFPGDRIVFGVDVVDNDYFHSKAAELRRDPDTLRKTHGIPQNYFLFVGRFLFRKGLVDLLEGYMKYRKSADKDQWDLVLVGGGKEEKLVTSLAKGTPGVHFAGPRYGASLCLYYALASALVTASIADQWGLVINEGMASGLPIIASRGCGAAQSLVRDGENGWAFEPGDTDTLAALMARMSSLLPGELRHMGERSREIIASWSVDRFAEGVLAAMSIPRRPHAGLISNLAVRLWKGRVRTT